MDPIHANYVRDGDDWKVTVSMGEKKLTGQAPGLIAARDRTDQLVEKLAPDAEHPTVVHLLNGDALEFTTAYLNARMAPTPPAAAIPAQAKPTETKKKEDPKKKTKKADQPKEAQPAPPA